MTRKSENSIVFIFCIYILSIFTIFNELPYCLTDPTTRPKKVINDWPEEQDKA